MPKNRRPVSNKKLSGTMSITRDTVEDAWWAAKKVCRKTYAHRGEHWIDICMVGAQAFNDEILKAPVRLDSKGPRRRR